MPDAWDPDQYERFRLERSAPFVDLLDLLQPVPGGRVIDFGCGTGELTAEAHRRLEATTTVGVDASDSMLERAAAIDLPGLSFRKGRMEELADDSGFDVILSNAALQWVPGHADVLARWTGLLREGGQLAVQVPANADHASHLVAAEVAAEEPFLSAFGGEPPPDPVRQVLPPERYATLLYELGFRRQHVRLQVYGHVLTSTVEVVEWLKGTSLTRFSSRLPEHLFDHYLERYRARLLEVLGSQEPYFYAFKRVLFWAAR